MPPALCRISSHACPPEHFLVLPAVGNCNPRCHASRAIGPQGGTVEIRFPVAKSFQDIAAQGGNPRPDLGRALLTFPVSFDPARNWPILVVTSTSDFNRTSPMGCRMVPSACSGRRMGSPRFGCDNQTSTRLDAMAPRDAGSGA